MPKFLADVIVVEEAYGVGWNSSLEAPSKNAVYDAVSTYALGVVNHGATAGTARPTGFAAIQWIGSVEPTNMANGDTWINTA